MELLMPTRVVRSYLPPSDWWYDTFAVHISYRSVRAPHADPAVSVRQGGKKYFPEVVREITYFCEIFVRMTPILVETLR